MSETADWRAAGVTMWTTALAVLLGLWVIASPFVYSVEVLTLWNAVIIGALVALVARYNLYRRTDNAPIHVGGASLTALLGL